MEYGVATIHNDKAPAVGLSLLQKIHGCKIEQGSNIVLPLPGVYMRCRRVVETSRRKMTLGLTMIS